MKDVDPSIAMALKRKIPRIHSCRLNARKRSGIMLSFSGIIYFSWYITFHYIILCPYSDKFRIRAKLTLVINCDIYSVTVLFREPFPPIH